MSNLAGEFRLQANASIALFGPPPEFPSALSPLPPGATLATEYEAADTRA